MTATPESEREALARLLVEIWRLKPVWDDLAESERDTYRSDAARILAAGYTRGDSAAMREAAATVCDAQAAEWRALMQGALATEACEECAFRIRALPAPEPVAFDFAAHLARQREWSERTFGPGPRTKGVIDHIRKELAEIEADPLDIKEWIDVVILALDGAWRSGFTPAEIVAALVAKQAKNEARDWPDWRTMSPDQAIEHVRAPEPVAPVVTEAMVEAALAVTNRRGHDYGVEGATMRTALDAALREAGR